MRRRSRWFLVATAILLAAVAAFVFRAGSDDRSAAAQVILENAPRSTASSISLSEAWELAVEVVSAWDPAARLIRFESVDGPGDDLHAGEDGRRRAWVGLFFGKDGRLDVEVSDGIVLRATQYNGVQAGGTEVRELQMITDSPAGLAIARSVVPLEPVAAKGTGLHFALYPNDVSGTDLVVVGSLDGFRSHVAIDTATGTVRETSRLTYGSRGGVMYSADGGWTWSASSLTGQFVTQVTAGTDGRGYATVASEDGILVYQSADGGASWALLSILPVEAGTWPFDIEAIPSPDGVGTTVLVGTRSGLWIATDGRSWDPVVGVARTNVQRIGTAMSGGTLRVFVSVVPAPSGSALYSSRDLISWAREAGGSFWLTNSPDRAAVYAVDPDTGRAFRIDANDKSERHAVAIEHPHHVFEVTDDVLIAQRPDAILRSADGGQTWDIRLQVGLGTVAVAESGRAVAGGFRTGVYLSEDEGQSWVRVVNDANTVVPGTGEVGSIAFLSPDEVIATNGGGLTWVSTK